MIPVDSSVWIDYFRGVGTPEADSLDGPLAARPSRPATSLLPRCFRGSRATGTSSRRTPWWTSLTIVELGSRKIVIRATRNHRALRALGITVRKTIDTIIATRCIEDDFALLYSDT